jgi:uncharacterized protein with NAD-binding domain and iron-sulfur cluster
MAGTVAVLGGGVGGLSAAHELAERGFSVEVFEIKAIPGGKARSIPVLCGADTGHGPPGSYPVRQPDRDLRHYLPGEHGFRFFPGFYMHLPDTMKRVPFGTAQQSCFDNLVATSRIEIAPYGAAPVVIPSRFPRSLRDLEVAFAALQANIGLKPGEAEHFAGKIWQIATSCRDRLFSEYEQVSWWEFIGAEQRSPAFQKFLAEGLSRSLVAAQAREASARTVGLVQVQLIFGVVEPGGATDRVLNGPTNEVWIEPWLAHLRELGVAYNHPWAVKGIECDGGRITAVQVEKVAVDETQVAAETRRVEADWYVCALPVEAFALLITPALEACDPALAAVPALAENVRWMNGLQIYLKEDVPITHGHILYVSSPWALTSISQVQFWHNPGMVDRGDGTVRGVLSVDISDWNSPGDTYTNKTAHECYRHDVYHEVWAELKRSLNVDGREMLRDDMVHSWFLDPDIEVEHPGRPESEVNLEALFINEPNTWSLRPGAVTRIPNFFLASDYVQTNSDLACMEAANEAARRSVNGILEASGSTATPCRIWPMGAPGILEPWRIHDQQRWKQGKPWDGCLL